MTRQLLSSSGGIKNITVGDEVYTIPYTLKKYQEHVTGKIYFWLEIENKITSTHYRHWIIQAGTIREVEQLLKEKGEKIISFIEGKSNNIFS